MIIICATSLVLFSQNASLPRIDAEYHESISGNSYIIQEISNPSKDEQHDYYPILQVKQNGNTIVEVTPEMLSSQMTEDDSINYNETKDGQIGRDCFGRGIFGHINYFCMVPPRLEVYVNIDLSTEKHMLFFDISLNKPHRVLRMWEMYGSSISTGIASPNDPVNNPNYSKWEFYACIVLNPGNDPINLDIIRPAFNEDEGGNLIELGASDVGANGETDDVDFEDIKWIGFKELAFDAIINGNIKHFVYDAVEKKIIERH